MADDNISDAKSSTENKDKDNGCMDEGDTLIVSMLGYSSASKTNNVKLQKSTVEKQNVGMYRAICCVPAQQ